MPTRTTHHLLRRARARTYLVLPVVLWAWAQAGASGAVLLNELKVNPPGGDEPYEFIELRGDPGLSYTNLYLLVLEGDKEGDPGTVDLQVDLSGVPFGANGFLIILGNGHPYAPPAETTVILHQALAEPGGALENGAISFLLASSPVPLDLGDDLDRGDNGVLERTPPGFTIIDAVGWKGGGKNDVVYGGAELKQPGSIPDAASRFPGNTQPTHAAAWYNGDLVDDSPAQLVYGHPIGENFPLGSVMTPGGPNYLAPLVDAPHALSGVVGDPTNPGITFTVDLSLSSSGPVTVSATSDDPAVIPDAHLLITPAGTNTFHLQLEPVGIGYADIAVFAANDQSTGVCHVAYAASRPERPGGTWLTGVSDGSAAVPIDDDWMMVADDENQIIRVYPRHVSGAPVATFDLEPYLNLTDYEDGVAREVDFEGVTRSGDTLYWLGSHSHAEIGELRPNRWRVVATQLTGAGSEASLSYLGHYEHLRDDLLAWDQTNGHGQGTNYYGLADSAADGVIPKEPHGAGFNIEGISMVPDAPHTAYICFRAPLATVPNRALSVLVPVTNFTTMAVAGSTPGQAEFGEPFELFLGGRGIRGIEGGPDGFLLTAGPVDNRPATAPHIYKLFSWSGFPEDPPREHSADLTFLNPECIVELPPAPWTPTSRVQVISDSGRTIYYDDNVPAKLLPEPAFRKFRSDWIELGEIVDSQPDIRTFRMLPSGPGLSWFAQTGRSYRVQANPALPAQGWTNLGDDVLADLPLIFHPLAPLTDPATTLRLLLLPQ